MPVRKLRSIDEADGSKWRRSDDPALWRQIDALWSMSGKLVAARFPPGVHKHRSIAAANQLSDTWERLSIRRRSG